MIKIKSSKRYETFENQMMPFDLEKNLRLCVSRLEIFSKYIEKNLPQDYPEIMNAIMESSKCHEMVLPIISRLKLEDLLENNKNLILCAMGDYLHLIDYDKYAHHGDQFDILVYDVLRGYLIANSVYLKALVKIIGREKGISVYKEYVDATTTEYKRYAEMDSVEENLFFDKPMQLPFLGSFDFIEFRLEDGRVGNKITKCKWATILKELGDAEYADAIACHYDFHACKCSNSNFELTRTQTVAGGGDYCDFVWHDKRINSDLAHPDKRFWDNIEKIISEKRDLTPEQVAFEKLNRELYNKGEIKKTYEMAKNAYEKNRDDLFYQYIYAVMCGDYSFDTTLESNDRKKMLDDAKKIIKDLFDSEQLNRYPENMVSSVKNEYYYFHQLFEEQFNHGQENVEKGFIQGYYSMCVGATELAKKRVENNDIEQAIIWANKGYSAFVEYEKVYPDWHNINYFAAITQAILGKYDLALILFKEMFRKQQKNIDEREYVKFNEEIQKIKLKMVFLQ